MARVEHLQVGNEHHHLDDARRREMLTHAKASEATGAVEDRERRPPGARVEKARGRGDRARRRVGAGRCSPPFALVLERAGARRREECQRRAQSEQGDHGAAAG